MFAGYWLETTSCFLIRSMIFLNKSDNKIIVLIGVSTKKQFET